MNKKSNYETAFICILIFGITGLFTIGFRDGLPIGLIIGVIVGLLVSILIGIEKISKILNDKYQSPNKD